MEHLLQSQIQESCRLALPDGLAELMTDISREVLRAQPSNLYMFITEYLSALLITREHLSIAARLFNDICSCSCHPELDEELRNIGLDEENATKAKEIIDKFLRKDQLNEGQLLMNLMKKAGINEESLPPLLNAIRRAFLRHQKSHSQIYESMVFEEESDTAKAVRCTLNLYKKTNPHYEMYNNMAIKIQSILFQYPQTAYRAYRLRLNLSNETNETTPAKKIQDLDNKITFSEPRTDDKGKPISTPGAYEIPSTSGGSPKLHLYKSHSIHKLSNVSDLDNISLTEQEHAGFHFAHTSNETRKNEENEFNRKDIAYIRKKLEGNGKTFNESNKQMPSYAETNEKVLKEQFDAKNKEDKKILFLVPMEVEDTAEEADDESEAEIGEDLIDEEYNGHSDEE